MSLDDTNIGGDNTTNSGTRKITREKFLEDFGSCYWVHGLPFREFYNQVPEFFQYLEPDKVQQEYSFCARVFGVEIFLV